MTEGEMRRRGRGQLPGGACAHAKLTNAQAAALRRRAHEGERLKDLAAEYGISVSSASQIKRGVTYRDAREEPEP